MAVLALEELSEQELMHWLEMELAKRNERIYWRGFYRANISTISKGEQYAKEQAAPSPSEDMG
jgi:hypothetical protein